MNKQLSLKLSALLLKKSTDNAQALIEIEEHEELQSRVLQREEINRLLARNNLYSAFKTLASDYSNPVSNKIGALMDGNETFDFREDYESGQELITMLNDLIESSSGSMKTGLTALQADLMSKANPRIKTFYGLGLTEEDIAFHRQEILEIGESSSTVLNLNIIKSTGFQVDIPVQQRFGRSKDEELTTWHDVGAFRNVEYHQRSYSCGIINPPSDYRELRIVSPFSLGMSV